MEKSFVIKLFFAVLGLIAGFMMVRYYLAIVSKVEPAPASNFPADVATSSAPGNTAAIQPPMSENEAKKIAETTCIKGGEALGPGTYNENSQTWWFDANLNAARPGCNPACVVSVETKTAEINWRCTGAIPPANNGQPTACTMDAKICPDGTAVGRVAPDCEFAACPQNNNFPQKCSAESRKAEICAQVYDPVCATVNIQCVKAPCDPVKQTFSNKCEACKNQLVSDYTKGECPR